MFFGPGYILMIVVAVAGMIVQGIFKNRFRRYSLVPLSRGLSGAEVAQKMLAENGIHDVRVISVAGSLTDHYNPAEKTVNLSPEVFAGRSVASAAVAAHECGHAVQHAHAYAPLKLRSALVPTLTATSKFVPWLLIIGIFTLSTFPWLLGLGILLFALTTVFSFITLPVEFDASRRALAWLDGAGIAYGEEHAMAKNALRWAAMTYVISALASLATLLYYLQIYNRRN